MSFKNRIRLCAAGSVLVVLGIGAFLPIWTTWYFCQLGAVGRRSSMWPMLAELPANFREARRFHEIWDVHQDNLFYAGLLVAVAADVGWAVLQAGDRRSVQDAVADYQEASGGAVPDDRDAPIQE